MPDINKIKSEIAKKIKGSIPSPKFGDNWKEYAKEIDKETLIDIAWTEGRKAILLEMELEKMIDLNSKVHTSVIGLISNY